MLRDVRWAVSPSLATSLRRAACELAHPCSTEPLLCATCGSIRSAACQMRWLHIWLLGTTLGFGSMPLAARWPQQAAHPLLCGHSEHICCSSVAASLKAPIKGMQAGCGMKLACSSASSLAAAHLPRLLSVPYMDQSMQDVLLTTQISAEPSSSEPNSLDTA